ncbi:hypothetical protein [Roseibium sp. SCP14]|uniref:hypothetical protein n=1 Tax=Roseibium sp. SCP14 TaxID=3141375 RepID=UPI003337E869
MPDNLDKPLQSELGELGVMEEEFRYISLADEEFEREIRRLQLKARALAKRDEQSDDIDMVLICLERIEICLTTTRPESFEGVRVRIRLMPILLYLRSKLTQIRRDA